MTPEQAEHLRDLRYRVYCLGMVHQMLMQSADLAPIEIGEYLRNLCRSLAASYTDRQGKVTLNVTVEPHDAAIKIDFAIPLGLLVTELVTNAYKHAFTSTQQGTSDVSLAIAGDGEARLVQQQLDWLEANGDVNGIDQHALAVLLQRAIEQGGTLAHPDQSVPGTAGRGRLPDAAMRKRMEEQQKLVARGASMTMDSRHITGHAVDLVDVHSGVPDRADRGVDVQAERGQLARHHGADAVGQIAVADAELADAAHGRQIGADAPEARDAAALLVDGDDDGVLFAAEREERAVQLHHLLERLHVAFEQDGAAHALVLDEVTSGVGQREPVEAENEELSEREVLHGENFSASRSM